METVRAERRLAAILAADIVGYSRLIEADETGTLGAIKNLRREVIDPLLTEHHGRIVKLMGDGAIAQFGSVVDAVACAVAIQKGVAARQPDVPAASPWAYRDRHRARVMGFGNRLSRFVKVVGPGFCFQESPDCRVPLIGECPSRPSVLFGAVALPP